MSCRQTKRKCGSAADRSIRRATQLSFTQTFFGTQSDLPLTGHTSYDNEGKYTCLASVINKVISGLLQSAPTQSMTRHDLHSKRLLSERHLKKSRGVVPSKKSSYTPKKIRKIIQKNPKKSKKSEK